MPPRSVLVALWSTSQPQITGWFLVPLDGEQGMAPGHHGTRSLSHCVWKTRRLASPISLLRVKVWSADQAWIVPFSLRNSSFFGYPMFQHDTSGSSCEWSHCSRAGGTKSFEELYLWPIWIQFAKRHLPIPDFKFCCPVCLPKSMLDIEVHHHGLILLTGTDHFRGVGLWRTEHLWLPESEIATLSNFFLFFCILESPTLIVKLPSFFKVCNSWWSTFYLGGQPSMFFNDYSSRLVDANPPLKKNQLPSCHVMSLRLQMLKHLPTQQMLLVLSSHLHWDQAAGHQASEAQAEQFFFGRWHDVSYAVIYLHINIFRYI